MSNEVLGTECDDGVWRLTIRREAAGNSISSEVSEALDAAVDAIATDPGSRAVVVSGAGDRFFCAGGDLKAYRALETRAQLEATFERPRRVLDRLESLPVPVIAAINGVALGGGAELALACDIRIAARHARIGFPYVRLGLMPGWHGTERLLRCCGHAAAMHLLLDGEPVDAERALALGLVSRVVGEEDVRDEAMALARRIQSAAPLSPPAIKRSLLAAARLPREEARAVAVEEFARLWLSDDHREAEAAFEEKRAPRFSGS